MAENDLRQAVLDKLAKVIDPETGIDVVRMKLVRDMTFDENGKITYTFRPSSPLCPIAVPLAVSIIQAIKEVPGVTGQELNVVDYIQADMLNDILKTII